jgi:hypothetical protein
LLSLIQGERGECAEVQACHSLFNADFATEPFDLRMVWRKAPLPIGNQPYLEPQ